MSFKFLAFAAAFAFAPGLSQALTLDCALNPSASTGGWVTERYVLQYDAEQGTALASDAVILDYNEGPIEATVSDDTGKKLVLTWRIQTKSATGQQVNMIFRASYFKSNKAITVRAVPAGYSNSFEARGTCKSL
jgi:hypothetical protein